MVEVSVKDLQKKIKELESSVQKLFSDMQGLIVNIEKYSHRVKANLDKMENDISSLQAAHKTGSKKPTKPKLPRKTPAKKPSAQPRKR